MAVRLIPMRRVLAGTGSIYLHCDPTASHYLKLLMDAIFGKANFRNEVIWYYKNASRGKQQWAKAHDVIFWYSKSEKPIFNRSKILMPYENGMTAWRYKKQGRTPPKGKPPDDVITLPSLNTMDSERLGYPTQKPLTLLEFVIQASSPPDGLVLDPFCGCGTAVHAAEKLGRRWAGIDISAFSIGLVRERILHNFEHLTTDDVLVRGVPVNIPIPDAEQLAQRDKFEFEKWVCGAIGASGMFHEPGTKGADGGVDGVLEFYPFRLGGKPTKEFAIIQVKGGSVAPDAVRALKTSVEEYGATAGVMVCFGRFMRTVENQRSKAMFHDDSDTYPVIQGFSVEDLLAGKPLNLPQYGHRRRGGRIGDQTELIASRKRGSDAAA